MFIIHGCHHKAGTVLMTQIHRVIAKSAKLKFQTCKQNDLDTNTNVWIQNHARIDFSLIQRPYKVSHIIRDLREISISGYHYHKKCSEKHVTAQGFINKLSKRKKARLESINELKFLLDGNWPEKSYQEILNNVPIETGLLFELTLKILPASLIMKNWDYDNPSSLEIKFEEFINNFNPNLRKLLEHYEIPVNYHDKIINAAQGSNPVNWKENRVMKSRHVNRDSLQKNGDETVFRHNKWEDQYTPRHKEVFKQLYGDLMIRLGYESDTKW